MTIKPDLRGNVEDRPMGVVRSESMFNSNDFMASLYSSVYSKSFYAPGTQVQLQFDPVAEVLIAKDRLSGKTVVAHAFSKSDDKGGIPYGKYEMLGHAMKSTWVRLDAVDGSQRNDVVSFDGQEKFVALRMHFGRASRGCITVTDDEKYHQEILPMIKGVLPERIVDRPESYRIFEHDFDLNDFGLSELLTQPSQNYKYGELEVISLNYCPALKTTNSANHLPSEDLETVSVSDRPNGLTLPNDRVLQDKPEPFKEDSEKVPLMMQVLP